MSNRINRNQLERDNASDDSEAIEDNENIIEDNENLPPVDEDSGEDLERNIDQDYQSIQELDQYERESADNESYSSMDEDQRRMAEEELDEVDRRRQPRKGRGFGQRLLEGLSDESEDQLHYGQRIEQRMQNIHYLKEENEGEDQEMDLLANENMEEEKFEEEKFLDKEQAKGRLHEWIQEDRTIRFIKFRFKSFLNNFKKEGQKTAYYTKSIKNMCEGNKSSLEVDYRDLGSKDNMKILLLWILYEPSVIIPILNEVVREIVLKIYPDHDNISSEFFVQITNMGYIDKLRDLRHKNIGHLLQVQGVITKRSAIFSQLRESYYICNKCGNRQGPIIENDSNGKQNLGNCHSCQSKGPFTLDQSKTIYRNYQKVTIQESPGQVAAGRVPIQKEVILLGDNIDVCRPGDEVLITGIYNYRYDYVLNVKHGFPLFSTCIEANYVKCLADVENVSIDPNELREIEKWAQKPNIKEIIINSISSSIYGHEDIKTAIALSLFGGVAKEISGRHRTRGDINVLIVGDPGVAKSQFLKSVQKTFQRTVYTTGKGATAVGLTASVKRDLDTKEWTLEGGALVLADQGMCLIDEFDKMNDYDRTSIHEAMEQQTISISKAGIVASLQARCSVIAAANPKTGRYNSALNFMDNVDLTDPIVSRFDILCVVKDEINPHKDQKLASFVINSHISSHPVFSALNKSKLDQEIEEANSQLMEEEEEENQYDQYVKELKKNLNDIVLTSQKESKGEIMPKELLKKYIIHARSIQPKITQLDNDKIKNFYVDLRQQSQQLGGLAIAVRHIESIIRMSESFAKMSLRNEVKGDDIDMAISVLLKSFIMSQKFVVANSLKNSFKKYIIDSRDNFTLLNKILSDLMTTRQKIIQRQNEKVSIPISLLQSKAEMHRVGNIMEYLESEDFKQLYVRVGDTIQLQ